MKSDIILAGVGGQGILSIANIIGLSALSENLQVKQAEVHGMSQRGGAVQAHSRLSSSPISSDLIPFGAADLIISVEPMESLRYLPYLSEKGYLVTSSSAFINIPNYPKPEDIEKEIKSHKNHVIIDADALAKELGSIRSSNMVMLGAASLFIPLKLQSFLNGITQLFSRKGKEVIELNHKAFEAGREASNNYLKPI
ncbi:MAG: indolepyruvate oxidoreductase subunit beta [Bacteroidales bacterium]|nr:indolepyruvate oxidoreductase subunit beta [Bacteroidales bacterium]MCF8390378.1 indolepyruvate oxidoreductase subunit beta [Bacteroidales bacterium]